MVKSDELEDLVGERVLVTMMNGDEIVGELNSYDGEFALTLAGDGGPNPDDMLAGDTSKEFVDGRTTLNGSSVRSVEPWDRPYADEQ